LLLRLGSTVYEYDLRGMPPTSMLEVRNLSKSFGEQWVLRDVSFSIAPAQILGIVGPNGSGKTTLFDCLAGVMAPTAGDVKAGVHPLTADQRKEHLFYVPETVRPWPDQDVGWVLSFIGGMFGRRAQDIREVAHSLAIDSLMDARMGVLSKGEHRRVVLASGLLSTQPVLVLDEPFDGLDLRQTREAMDILRSHASAGRGIVLSIHQLVDAPRVCDRLLLLDRGALVAEGTPDELRARAHVSGGFDEVFLALT
jgi:ABC-2 type transport system ATP-binding protein